MAQLEHRERRLTLSAHTELGRSKHALVTLDERAISSLHARVWWTGGQWWVRDLGSRNGTFLNGRQLEPGEDHRLSERDDLAFGDPEVRWRLISAEEPVARARCLHCGIDIVEQDGVLALPDDGLPAALIWEEDGDWLCTVDGVAQVLADQQVVTLDGKPWRLSLPHPHEPTVNLPRDREGPRLTLNVSADREHILVEVHDGTAPELYPHRAHHELLLLLAEARLEDEAAGLGAEAGWRDSAWLAAALRVVPATVNLHVHRLRRRLAVFSCMGEGGVIERRSRRGPVRIAGMRVRIRSLEDAARG